MHLLEFGRRKTQLAPKIVASEFVGQVPSALFSDVLQVSEFRLIESHSVDLSARQRCDQKGTADRWMDRSSLCRSRIRSCWPRSLPLALASWGLENIGVVFRDSRHFDLTTPLL